jgi:hypothetical protein
MRYWSYWLFPWFLEAVARDVQFLDTQHSFGWTARGRRFAVPRSPAI